MAKREIVSRELWQKRRDERREKQRALNGHRAVEMGRLGKNAFPIAAAPDPVSPEIRTQVGCSGWFYWHWRGLFYPAGLPTNQWFNYYQRRFQTVELNAPFYAWPTMATVKTWKRQATRRNFRYSVKANELITHRKQFVGTKKLVKDFGYIADVLGEAFGCFLFQLPPSFHFTQGRLMRILKQLQVQRQNVVEFRHKSWWIEPVFRAFRDHNVTFCSCSGPRLPDGLIETGNCAYVRFHGKPRWYRHDYTREELKAWADQLNASNTTQRWIYFNNDREGFALKNARAFRRLLAQSQSGRRLALSDGQK